MLDRLLKLEEHLARAEAVLLVVFVGLMLGLATYNVFYRNILVPIQVDLLTEEAAEPEVAPTTESEEPDGTAEPATNGDDGAAGFGGGFGDAPGGDDGAAGFGGGFEEEGDDGAGGFGGGFDEDQPEPTEKEDGAAGFGGGFDDEQADDEAVDDEPADTEQGDGETDDGAAGFGGGFGPPEESGDDGAGGFAGGFGDGETDVAEPAKEAPAPAAEGPAPESEEPWLARFIDAIKLEWIDQVLRQLVLIVGFLGAMLATRRRKHITIDALSKLLNEKTLHWAHLVTNSVSIFICVLLAKAGRDLVNISIEYPKEILPWADEWVFQLVFPIGFGLLALHFTIRWVETLYYALGKAEPRPMAEGGEL